VAVRELGRALDGSPTYVQLDPANGRALHEGATQQDLSAADDEPLR